MKHTFGMGDARSRQFREALKRAVGVLKGIGSAAAENTADSPPQRVMGPQEPQTVERRFGDRRRHGERRRSEDGAAPVVETPRILLIEPYQDTRLLHACLLEEAGYAVYVALQGAGVIDAARGRLPDVVVLELPLPGDDGSEIMRQLREDPITSTIPIVVMTSFFHFDFSARGRTSGAMSVLGKPTSPETLLAEVDELMMATPRERLVVRKLRRSLLMLRDLGKRVNPEERAQERVRTLIDRLQVAILALDTQGNCVAVSRGASTLTGYSRSELLGRSIFDTALALNPPASERWQELLTREQSAAETIMRDRNGNTVTVQTEFATILPGLHAAAFAGHQNMGLA